MFDTRSRLKRPNTICIAIVYSRTRLFAWYSISSGGLHYTICIASQSFIVALVYLLGILDLAGSATVSFVSNSSIVWVALVYLVGTRRERSNVVCIALVYLYVFGMHSNISGSIHNIIQYIIIDVCIYK